MKKNVKRMLVYAKILFDLVFGRNKNIVKIINFIRGVESRPSRNIDLYKPVSEQIRIMKEKELTGISFTV